MTRGINIPLLNTNLSNTDVSMSFSIQNSKPIEFMDKKENPSLGRKATVPTNPMKFTEKKSLQFYKNVFKNVLQPFSPFHAE